MSRCVWRYESGCDCVGVIARVIRRVCGKGSFDCGRSVCVCVCVCVITWARRTVRPLNLGEYQNTPTTT